MGNDETLWQRAQRRIEALADTPTESSIVPDDEGLAPDCLQVDAGEDYDSALEQRAFEAANRKCVPTYLRDLISDLWKVHCWHEGRILALTRTLADAEQRADKAERHEKHLNDEVDRWINAYRIAYDQAMANGQKASTLGATLAEVERDRAGLRGKCRALEATLADERKRVGELESVITRAIAANKRARDMVPDEDEGLASEIFAKHINWADTEMMRAMYEPASLSKPLSDGE